MPVTQKIGHTLRSHAFRHGLAGSYPLGGFDQGLGQLTPDHLGPVLGGGPVAADPDGTFAGTLGDPDFVPPEKATVNLNPIWWVDSPVGTPAVREKTDMLLYARDDLGAVQPFVECGSCHDPHNSSTAGPTTVAFLRIDNTASQICTACHIK